MPGSRASQKPKNRKIKIVGGGTRRSRSSKSASGALSQKSIFRRALKDAKGDKDKLKAVRKSIKAAREARQKRGSSL